MAANSNFSELVHIDDYIEYYLFPSHNFIENNDVKKLNSLLLSINAYIENYCREYIWHRDEFNLTPKTSNTSLLNNDNQTESIPPHLYGISCYGDNIEDEWFIVYLLIQLTKEFEGVVVRVVDNDGEFILIEAADYLPEWANPDTCAKRVYIYNGYIHIVAPEIEDETESVNVETAISEICKNPSLTVASKNIQECIMRKIQDYPQKIKENQYKCAVYVPIGVASILQANPKLISPAVQTFCNRDTLDMKACRAMKYFPPEVRVLTRVTLTKCLYAMLTHSKYQPDRKTGWNLPSVTSKNHKAHSLGMKLACGFEILVSQAKISIADENDREWNMYKKKLEEKGYFKGLLENSKEYNQLLSQAKEYYSNSKNTSINIPTLGQDILELLQTLDHSIEKFRQEQDNLPPDDDDSWLNISPDDLDKMLEDQYGKQETFILNGASNATRFTENVDGFLKHVSDLEGAEFPNHQSDVPIRPPRGNKRNKGKVSFSPEAKSQETSGKVNFDPSSFACAVQNILNFVIPEDDSWDFDSDSDMSEYDLDENGTKGESNKLQELMDAMDKELAQTTIGESFVKRDVEGYEDIEEFKPVDIDANALKNILESYKSQLGEAGPSSNMLGPMGIHLKENINGNK